MTDSVNIRELALDTLVSVMEHGELSHVTVRQTLKKYQYLDKRDRSFYTRISEGTIENCILIDYVIDRVSNIKTAKMKPLIRNLLRVSVYQILFMDSVPDSAVCNEAVKLAVKRGFGPLKGFVNGVLRNIARRKDDIQLPDASEDLVMNLSVTYSMPVWLVEKFIFQYGAEDASILLKSFLNHDNRICVRCNTARAEIADIIKMLEEDEVKVTVSNRYSNALFIEEFDYLEKVKAFNEGYLQVQDISSMLVACAAMPKDDDFIMDICAAPGGKTIHLADLTHGKAKILARDVSEQKTELIEENIARAGFANVETEVWDGTVEDERYFEKADIVVADVPCSGLGVIGKKPDIKYNASEEGCKSLVKLQRKICEVAVKYVKPGGTFVYSTCTINKDENEKNFRWMVENFDLEPMDITACMPQSLRCDSMKEGFVQILPDTMGSDGFFIAAMKKKMHG